MVLLPLTNREIPVIADAYVDREFGTGALKITPAHDVNDFEVGRRHKLPEIDVMTDDGHMSPAAGKICGPRPLRSAREGSCRFAGRGAARKSGRAYPRNRDVRSLRHDHRAARFDAVVRENEATGRASH